jgi:hypothetical protein
MKKKLLKECRGWLKVTEDFEHGDWLNCPRLQMFLLDIEEYLMSMPKRPEAK